MKAAAARPETGPNVLGTRKGKKKKKRTNQANCSSLPRKWSFHTDDRIGLHLVNCQDPEGGVFYYYIIIITIFCKPRRWTSHVLFSGLDFFFFFFLLLSFFCSRSRFFDIFFLPAPVPLPPIPHFFLFLICFGFPSFRWDVDMRMKILLRLSGDCLNLQS